VSTSNFLGGVFGQMPSYMGGLLGAEDQEKLRQQAQDQGLLNLGLTLLAGSGRSPVRRSTGELVAQGLQAGQQAYRGAVQQAVQDKMIGMQLEEAAKKRRQEELFNKLLMPPTAEQTTDMAGRAMGTTGPTAEAAARFEQSKQAATPFGELTPEQRMIAAAMGREGGLKFLSEQLKQEYSTTPSTVMIGGRPTLVQFSKTGAMKVVNASPLPNEEQINVGDEIRFRDKNTGVITGSVKLNIGPAEAKRIMLDEERLKIERQRLAYEGQRVGMEGQRLNLANLESQRGAYKVVDTPEGQVYVPVIPGMPAIPVQGAGGQPVMGAASKLPEAQQKQVIGAQNTVNAIKEFRDSLSSFTTTDALNPAKRADIQAKYRNMQLQAKEAYNLGVLNGPDLTIIEQLVVDPTTVTGVFTGKKSIDKQASELSRIITDMGNVAAGRPKEVTGAVKTEQKAEQPKEAAKTEAIPEWLKKLMQESQKELLNRSKGQ
jgi:hypothetical protein